MVPAPLYCGDPVLDLALLPKHDPAGGVPALFAGRRVSYSFNARVAIRKACDILSLKPGDEVLAPAYNCGSELDPLLDAGLTVRLYSVDPRGMVDPATVARIIGPRTKAVYLTHYFGFLQPATAAMRSLCDARGLRLIEDCALSLLSGSNPAGGRTGDVSVFCFYKFFPVIGGGALVINAPDLADRPLFRRPAPWRFVARHLARAGAGRLLGENRIAALKQYLRGTGPKAENAAEDRLPDMPAHYYFQAHLRDTRISSLTLRALAGFDVSASITARRANYQRLLGRLEGIPGMTPLFPTLAEDAVPLGMPVLIEGNHRDALALALQSEGISATPWWSGYHQRLMFTGQPDACRLKDKVLFLPTQPWLNRASIDHIAARTAALMKFPPRMSTT